MRAWKGIVLILSSIVVTLVAWQNAGLSEFVVPGLALTSLSLTFLLSTKFRILESYFQGIENMYFYHKVMAVFFNDFASIAQNWSCTRRTWK